METVRCMLKVAERQSKGYLDVEDIENFPCIDLRTIDQLWVKCSDGKFGFSVQKKIYQGLGGTKEYDREVWKKFGDKVGWRKGDKWLSYNELTFSSTHYTGHLPVGGYDIRWIGGKHWVWWNFDEWKDAGLWLSRRAGGGYRYYLLSHRDL